MLSSAYRPIMQPAEIRAGRRSALPSSGPRGQGISYFAGNAEPSLDEVMADPIINRLMVRDGVAVEFLRSLIAEVRSRLP